MTTRKKSKKLERAERSTDLDSKRVVCTNCGKQFIQSAYSALSDCIMQNQPACSYECNKALGQAQ